MQLSELPIPAPREGEILLEVKACGVCHTELDEIEGRVVVPRLPIIPGHEVVGTVVELGHNVTQRSIGERVGVGWIHSSSGADDENVSPQFRATGCHADGGYAEYMTVPERYAFPIPGSYSDVEAAPLLCAGAIGYRALKLCGFTDGDPLGLMGFGGSAHLVLQLARRMYPHSPVHVFARTQGSQLSAIRSGADSAHGIEQPAPEKLQAVIDTTPAWSPVIASLENLRPGGRLVINAIRKEDDDKECLTTIRYHDHLWMEREIKSVANITGSDIAEFLPLAASIPIVPTVETFPLTDANRALRELKYHSVDGCKVLVMNS